MIKVKHFMDAVEADDGQRVWVEPVGLTRELRQWCWVRSLWSHLAPPRRLWDWFQKHPDGWDYFRGKYHQHLAAGPYRTALMEIAAAAQQQNFTLLHQADDPNHNSAAALHEFISELSAYCK